MVNFTKNKRILCSKIAILTMLVGCSDPVDRKREYDEKSLRNMRNLLRDQIHKINTHIDDIRKMRDFTVSNDSALSYMESVKKSQRLRQIAPKENDEYEKKIEELKKTLKVLDSIKS
ncbi:hypothetical protein CKC_03635 [Candidatus Liberibacter solanacearum CLso-ZC1]|uniref:Uncharacterized protein n=1 Tax=Liberibacter solanacearum (strain CLso-ZC1) TaxID=658172 RepID=E4UBH0_LIBSC|nr:hypothetical protein [Candidatus Liberibacter solanacearum]ADR52476.1 hypothetical protein CKC_03635 [Candidatus Liberibacter solanacearum CLso-ZC1]